MFKAYFIDGTTFEGRSLPDSQWNEMPDKPIEKLEYFFTNKKLIFEGYREYNHLFENKGGIGMPVKKTKLFLMGREENRTCIATFDLMERKLYLTYTHIGHEYSNQILGGWKKGIPFGTPSFRDS